MIVIQKAVIRRGDTYLILKRSPSTTYFPEYWDFPGGKLEKGEEAIAGIEREVKEETGLTINVKKIIGRFQVDVLNKGFSTHEFVLFETELLSEQEPMLSSEHTELAWKTKDEILNLKVEPYIKKHFSIGTF